MQLGGMLAWPADKPAIEQALAAARMFFPQPREMNSARQEGLSLVSHFLFYPDERAGLALHWSESLSAYEGTLAMEQAKEKLKLVNSAKDSPLPGAGQSV